MSLDKFFGEGSLVTFDTAVDARTARVAPVMGDVLSMEKSVELTFELLAVIGLHVLDRHGAEALQLFEEVPGIAAVEAGIRQGESQLAFDVNGRVEIHLQLIQFTHHGIQLPVSPICRVRRIPHSHTWKAFFARVFSPFCIGVVIDPATFLEEQLIPLDDLADGRKRNLKIFGLRCSWVMEKKNRCVFAAVDGCMTWITSPARKRRP